MCEFKVFLDGEKVAEDVVYARVEGKRVTVMDILGIPVVLEGVKLEEVDVMSTRLVLTRTD